MSCIYTTYDNKLKEYLHSKGLNDILTGRNIKTGKRFWVYERTHILNEYLKTWKSK